MRAGPTVVLGPPLLYDRVMTQAELNDIWDSHHSGKLVEGWGGRRDGDRDYLQRLRPGAAWERKGPDGKWEPVPGMAPFGI